MSIASKKANKAKKAKKDKLRREKARLLRAKQAAASKGQADKADDAAEKGTAIPGKPTLANDWLPLKGKAVGRSSTRGHRTQGK